MCSDINNSAAVTGAGKGANGWFRVARATVAFDHPTFSSAERALLLDFAAWSPDLSERVAVELDLESGRALLRALADTIRAAEARRVA
jgi:hypothetical protein